MPDSFHRAYAQVVFTGAYFPAKFPAQFAIISAYATTGEHWSDAENMEADERLRKRLAPWPSHRVTGQSPDGKHAEPSWAVACSQAIAVAIGRDYKQDAIFWVEAGALSIVDCAGIRPAQCVGSFVDKFSRGAEKNSVTVGSKPSSQAGAGTTTVTREKHHPP